MSDKTQSLTNEDVAQVAEVFVKQHGTEIWKQLRPKIEVNPGYEKYIKDVLLMGVEIGVAETLKLIRDAADEA